ncbi:MAG: AI-2E family transporter [Vicinamibacterales bacterium]|jgi:predicted PurR-regulated permease PerM|nr:hypothetical protein [Acidobacteriota bacterium]MDP7471711.1 AI-2E family transporter [Vicinamibacterales bacterium]MDP7670574.1 AI-2E family transporter [Vicinamibacterales bacterium]HJO39142.1 AI-2E family transporter [Vicinamibacterales bacterium]|tara:strand:- start:1995 stop:3059 length:1065 start_codon:yes stop_codon:yes gene_type:complete
MIADDHATPDRGARFLFIAASLVVVVAGLRAAGQVLLPFMVSVFLAIIFLPFMAWLRRKGAPTALAVLATVLTAVAFLAAVVIVVGRSLNEFTAAAPGYQARVQQLTASGLAWLDARGIETAGWGLPQIVNPGALMDVVGGTLRAVAAVAQNIFLVILTMVFILAEAAGFSRKLKAAFGERSEHFDRFGVMARQVQRYLAIKTLISLGTGILVGLWVSVLGLGFPLLWGLVAFIFNYIPNLGSILAAIPPVLLALVQFGPGHAAIVASGYLVINIGLANFLEPYLMGRRLGLSTLVVLLSLIFWGWVWGPVGMLLSVPLTVIVKIALENTEDFRWVAVMLDANPARSAPRFLHR